MATKRYVTKGQDKEIIAKVYHWLKHEAEKGVENLADARWRTAQATGLNERTVSKIVREDKDMDIEIDTAVSNSKSKREGNKIDLENYDIGLIRRTIISFHTNFNEQPTFRKLKDFLSKTIGFDGCAETLRRVLKKAGFEWFKTDDKRKAIIENHDLQMWRLKYLKQIKKYRNEGRYIVFTDEISVNVNTHRVKNIRIFIVYAGGNQGGIPNGSAIFKATSNDQHENLNHDTYKTWITTQLLPNLPENSIIVMNNALHQNVLSEKAPNPTSKKAEMEAWLTQKKIPFGASLEKIELYDLLLQHKDKFKSYVIEELCRSKGFDVIRLLPHHSELNPVLKVWEIARENVYKNNAELGLASNMALIKEEIEAVDTNSWENICRLVENMENQYMNYFEKDKQCIIYVDDDDGESVSDESDSNTDDSNEMSE